MNKYKNDIYDLCSKTVERALRLFCEAINSSDADVFIIMAHKAVRLFQVLMEQNHITDSVASKIIIADQALDFDCTYLIGKKIAIIDDIMISGTSIASTVQKLLTIGVPQSDISIITLATDRRYMTMRFDGSDGKSVLHCETELEDSTCIELSAAISAIFAYYGLPYDVDFPEYPAYEMDEKQLYFLFNDFLWDATKLPNNDLKDSNSESYVLFPRKTVLELLWNRIGANLEECAHLKLRVYVENYPSGRKRLQVVPLCLFDGISEDYLDALYELRQPVREDLRLNPNRIPLAKLRYVQYDIAHQFYLVFRELTALPIANVPFEYSTQVIFGVHDGARVYTALSDVRDYSEIKYVKKVDCLDEGLLEEYQASHIYQNTLEDIQRADRSKLEEKGYWINNILISPFIWWYDTKEIPVRLALSAVPRHYINDYSDIDSMLMRLRIGFPLQTIHHLFKSTLSDYEAEPLVSLFIDRAIDKGIIVPTVYHNKKERYLCRAYRHGEDLPFGLSDECRLLYFIKNLSLMIPNIEDLPERHPDGIAKISLEKLIVLFYQIGLKRGGVFNRFLGFNNIRLLKPFLSLHGVINGFIDRQEMQRHNIQKERFFSEQDENGYRYITWLTTWLESNNFIRNNWEVEKEEEKQVYYIRSEFIQNYLDKNERCCISAVIKEEIEYIARILSTWYNHMAANSQKDEFKRNAIALTSCSDAYVFSSAISTEIHYFSKFWKKQVVNAIDNSCSPDQLIGLLSKTDIDKKHTINTGQALNSGRDKVSWFEGGEAIKVINDVADILKNERISGWVEIWESVQLAKYGSEQQDFKLYMNQVVGFLYFYSACYDCLRSEAFWDEGIEPPKYMEYKKRYQKQCKITSLLNGGLFSQLDTIRMLSSFNEKKTAFHALVKKAITDSEDAVDNIETAIESQASNYTARYKSSLIFDIDPLMPSDTDEQIMAFWNSLNNDTAKTQTNIIRFPEEMSDEGFIRYGIFYGDNSRKNKLSPVECGEYLIDIYKRLSCIFDGKAYRTRAIMLPDTPPGRMFEHNVQRNIIFNAEKFTQRVINYLKGCYRTEITQQFLLGSTDYVEQGFGDLIKNMRWDHNDPPVMIPSDDPFVQLTAYYNDYVKPESQESKDIAYSIVKVCCGEKHGAGFLLRVDDQILCISCNHILEYAHQSPPLAISEYHKEIVFSLLPLKEILSYNENDILPASDEVMILLPQWEGRIPFDLHQLISLDDLDEKISNHIGDLCSCCGYPENDTLLWSDPLNVRGHSTKGYYQMLIDQGNNTVQNGYSGGIVRLDRSPHCILGIHEGRHGDYSGRVIPSVVIKEEVLRRQSLWQNPMS